MAQFGNPSSGTTAPSSGYFYDDVGNSQFWSGFTSWPGGIVTDVYVYAAGDSSTPSSKLCLWLGNTLVWSSGAFNFSSSGRSIDGQAWQHVGGLSQYVSSGTLSIGFWTSGNVIWTYGSGGSTQYQRTGSPANQSSAGAEGSGMLGAYVLYTPGNGHVMRSGSFVAGPGTVNRAGTQTNGVFYVMRSGSWVQGS